MSAPALLVVVCLVAAGGLFYLNGKVARIQRVELGHVLSNVDPAAERAVRLAEAAFQQRRKMIRRSLAAASEDASSWIAAAGLDPTARAERLSPADYLELARGLTS